MTYVVNEFDNQAALKNFEIYLLWFLEQDLRPVIVLKFKILSNEN